MIEENLYSHFGSLPRHIRGTEEETKLRMLHVILGYLRLLGKSLKTVFNDIHLLKRMSQSLIQVYLFNVIQSCIFSNLLYIFMAINIDYMILLVARFRCVVILNHLDIIVHQEIVTVIV